MLVGSWVLVIAVADVADGVRALEAAAFERARAGELAASTALLARLHDESPNSERACLWQERVVLNAIAIGEPLAMWRAAEELLARWRARAPASREDALGRVCRADVVGTLRYLAARWHIEGDEECDGLRLELAERAHRTYLAEFPGEPEAAEVQYDLAMVLMARARLVARGPDHPCGAVLCGRAARAQGRRRGESIGCGAFGPVAGEPDHCRWLRAAQVAFLKVLELEPEGRRAAAAASAQLVMAAAITDHWGREGGERCRTNSDGLCVVAGVGPRGPACFEPTAACYSQLARADRWPTVMLSGVGHAAPVWRMP